MLVGCRAPAGKGSGGMFGAGGALCGTAPAWGVEFKLINAAELSPATAHALVPIALVPIALVSIALVPNATVSVDHAGAWALPGRVKLSC
jgi:hypothetical protein